MNIFIRDRISLIENETALPLTRVGFLHLIQFLHQELHNLPDNRKGSNTKYKVKDAVIAAFSVFFQCSSFLQHQSLMKQKKGKDSASEFIWVKRNTM